jgi:hypothetical protein
MRRVGFALGALLILVGALVVPAVAQQQPFTDVPQGHWAYDAVNKLSETGLIEGYPDGQFKGKQTMTRYEFAQAIARMMGRLEEMKGVPGPAGPPGPAGAGGGLTAEQQALLDRLATEFAPELRALRSDLDRLTKRVDELEAKCSARGPEPTAGIPRGSGVGSPMPSLGGPTGIVSVPNALIAPRSLEMALSYQKLTTGEGMYDEDDTVWSLQALARMAERAELWAAYSTIRDGDDAHMWGVGGKLALTREPQAGISLALGASYQQLSSSIAMYSEGLGAFDIEAEEKVTKAYLVATKDLAPGAGTHTLASAGLMYMRARVSESAFDMSYSESESLTRPFVGLEFMSPRGSGLGLEYRWKDDTLDSKAVMSAVLRLAFSQKLSAEVGTTNADPVGFGMDDQNFFFRLGYSVPLGTG